MTKKEHERDMKKLAKVTAQRFGVDEIEARKRLDALYKSGILNLGTPDDPEMQAKIDGFLMIPSQVYAHMK